jgi:hypothetical protein
MGKGRRGRGEEPPTNVIDIAGIGPRTTLPNPIPLSPRLRSAAKRMRDVKTPLGYLISRIPGGRRQVSVLLALAEHEDAQKLASVWKGLSKQQRASVTMEEILRRAEIGVEDFIRIVQTVATTINYAIGETLHAFEYPRMRRASIDAALESGGTTERRMHFEKSGFASTKKGAMIQVNNTNANFQEHEPAPGEATPFDRTARKVVRDIPARPALPIHHEE